MTISTRRIIERFVLACAASVVTCCYAQSGGEVDEQVVYDASAPHPGPRELLLPEETADEKALEALGDWQGLPVLGDGIYVQMSSAEQQDLPQYDVFPMLAEQNRDMNNFLCASPDAERGMPELIPITLELSSCPEDYVRGLVMARFEGSGRLARLWLTALSLAEQRAGREILRIYVDDGREPLLQVPLARALDGSAGEIFAPPFGAGSMQHLAWYYPVVFGSRLVVALDGLGPLDLYYHQTDAVLDRQPAPRKAASSRLDYRDGVADLLEGELAWQATEEGGPLALAPGQPVTGLDLQGPGTIREIRLRSSDLPALEAVKVSVYWDDSEQPAAELPLLDLFAASLDPLSGLAGLALRAEAEGGSGLLRLRLPMPFRSRALWVLQNQGRQALFPELYAESDGALPEAKWGYLHVQRFETVGPSREPSHPLAAIRGRGRLVGVCLMLEGHGLDSTGPETAFNFLEGDELGVIDGRRALAGTGTEDYLNGSFYFLDGDVATAFAQARASAAGTSGRVTGCRWHILGDAVDFMTSLDLDLEIGPGQPSLLDRYRSVAYYYQ
jgi:hypothetical protein